MRSAIFKSLSTFALLIFWPLFAPAAQVLEQATSVSNRYEYRQQHSPDGIGKFYLGREIAHVMGHQAAEWLERPEREQEERASLALEALKLKQGEEVGEIRGRTGY